MSNLNLPSKREYTPNEISMLLENFIAVSSHKYLTPLTAIKWAFEIIEKETKDINPQYSNIIKQNILQIEEMFDTMIKIINVRAANNDKTFRMTINEFLEYLNLDYIVISNEIPKEESLNLRGEKFLYNEIFRILLNNTNKYSVNPPKVSIQITKAESYMIVKYCDNATPIPEEYINYIGMPFYRADDVVKKGIKGLGLDLYYLLCILDLVEGEISVTSTENGNCYTIKFIIKNYE